ncbi:MAG: SIMPL domain-containing protein [Pseudohongiellaceae bacterium]
MLSPRLLASVLLLPSLLSMPALAQNQLSLGQLQPGQLALNLSLTEETQVDQDTLNASLEYVAQGRDRRDLQEEVNRIMQVALERSTAVAGIEASTTWYHVQIVQTGRPTRTDIEKPVFRAQQGLQLASRDSAALLELLGALQAEGLTLNGLHYSLSDSEYERVSGELLQTALGKLQGRAQDAALALGKGKAELVEVSMDGSPNFMAPQYRMAPMAMSAEMVADFAAPVAEPGETTISVSISARAVLSP